MKIPDEAKAVLKRHGLPEDEILFETILELVLQTEFMFITGHGIDLDTNKAKELVPDTDPERAKYTFEAICQTVSQLTKQ